MAWEYLSYMITFERNRLFHSKNMDSSSPSEAYLGQWTNHHWFRYWLVARLVPSHYLNQCWNFVNWTLWTKFSEIVIHTSEFIHFHSIKCIWNRRLWNGGHFFISYNVATRQYSKCILGCEIGIYTTIKQRIFNQTYLTFNRIRVFNPNFRYLNYVHEIKRTPI